MLNRRRSTAEENRTVAGATMLARTGDESNGVSREGGVRGAAEAHRNCGRRYSTVSSS